MKNNKIILALSLFFIVVIALGGYLLAGNTPAEQPPEQEVSPLPIQADPEGAPAPAVIAAEPVLSTASSNDTLYLAISILSLGFTLSVGITFYLYRWRKILLSNPSTVVPEEWAKFLQDVGKGLHTLSDTVEGNLQRVASASVDQSSKIANMTETYMELQGALDDKDKEISRLKAGYDSEIFRRFIVRFARIEQALDDFIIDSGDSEEYTQLKRLFEDAFEECGVTKNSPSIGDDYRTANGVSDNPKTENTDNPELEFQISEVIESGYELNTGAGSRTIIPSKVRIYKLA